MNILQIRGEFSDNGPGTQTLTISTELRKRGHKVVLCSSGGYLTDKINILGFKYYIVPTIAYDKRSFFNIIKSIFSIKRILTENSIDVVHGHNAAVITMVNIASLLAFKKVKCFQSVRGVENRKKFFFRNWIYKINSYKKLFAVSEYTKNKLILFGISDDKIVVTYNGTDLDRFNIDNVAKYNKEIRSEFNIPENAIVIGIIGRQDGHKGHRDLIKAFGKLYKEFPNVYIVLVGEGLELDSNKNLAKKLNVDKRTIFTGLRIDVEKLHASFDIFTLLSLKGYEMFPNVIVEAMTYAKPFVSVNTTGIPEMATKQQGFICDCGDMDCYIDKFKYLIENDDIRIKMGLNGRKSVLDKFNINEVINKIEKAYKE
jgi:glycosyltransferase involved in cell wall biosynthesis